jgi:uncharacterized repeat protein (TIGR03803 family)
MTHNSPNNSLMSISNVRPIFRSTRPATGAFGRALILTVISAMLLTARAVQAQTETVLYSFGSQPGDGSLPLAHVVLDKWGNLDGTTFLGGASGYGAIFKINPAGAESVLYSFPNQDFPNGGLLLDKEGNLYGATEQGGTYGQGMVFKLTAAGDETVLYSFGSQSGDGAFPVFAGLVFDKKGNIYGTTFNGGAHYAGTVFKLTPEGSEVVLYSFAPYSEDGSGPSGGLVLDKKGNLYGTTLWGGTYGNGTVFKLTADGTETVLHSFGQSGDGIHPETAGLVLDKQGNLYGTTEDGGAYGKGIVFKVSPDGTETVLHNFGSQPEDGTYPFAGLILDNQGNLYGTTEDGGAYDEGTVFKLTPSGTETVLYSFGSQPEDGYRPWADLAFDKQGNLYGTTNYGGAHGGGTVFKLTL